MISNQKNSLSFHLIRELFTTEDELLHLHHAINIYVANSDQIETLKDSKLL